MPANIENSATGHRTGKGQNSLQSQRKALPKNVQITTQLHISHASKIMLKILQPRLQQYVNHEPPDVQAGFRKARGSRDQIANIRWIIGKARKLQKNPTSLLTMLKPLTVWITTNWKILCVCSFSWGRKELDTTE